jgi:hypothetical protein
MSDGIMIASDCADWWDEQLKNYHAELEAYVMEHPNYWGIAALKATGADLAHLFFVDLIRLGEGAAEGGLKGWAQDLLRVMQFIPAGKILKGVKNVRPALGVVVQRATNVVRWRGVTGMNCVPVSIAQALQRTGQRYAISLLEIAKAIDTPLETIQLKGLKSLSGVAAGLEKLGVQFDMVPPDIIKTIDQVYAKAMTVDGPILVAIETMKGQKHATLVQRTRQGIKIIDEAGVFNSFDALARFKKVSPFKIMPGQPVYVFKNAIIDESLLPLAKGGSIFAALVRITFGLFDFNRARVTPDFVKADFQHFVAARKGKPNGHGPGLATGVKFIDVVAGNPSRSTLSGIAKAELGSANLWPLIWDLNRAEIGPNPNLLRPTYHGHKLRLSVLPLSAYTPEQITDARRRASSWKNYPLPDARK